MSADLGRDLGVESKILTVRQNEIVTYSSLLAFAVNAELCSALHRRLNVNASSRIYIKLREYNYKLRILRTVVRSEKNFRHPDHFRQLKCSNNV